MSAPQPAPLPPLSNPSVKQPMDKGVLDQWREDIEKSRTIRKKVSVWWDANLKAYAPQQNDDPEGYGQAINTNRDFTLVERKKADLFYQRPDVTALPSPLMEGQEALLETHTQILNEKLGLDGVDAESLVDQVLFDVLCPSGTGWTVMGYESATVDTPMDVPAETKQPGSILGLAPGTPTTTQQMAPVPVYEDCFWTYLSPKCALIPASARTTDADSWPWIGFEFEIDLKTAQRKGWVDAKATGTQSDPELHFDHGLDATGGAVVKGQFLYYKSSLFRDDRPHPLHQTRLILIDGQNEPAENNDSPYQTLDAQGRLTPDSLIGYAIHPCTIRTLTDSAYVPSDCTISRPLVNELNKFREQMVEQREANVLRWAYNVDALPPDALNKIVKAPVGGFIGLPGEAYVGEGAIKELPHGTYPRENFQFNDYLDNDLARTHAIDAEQSGAGNRGEQSATESQIKQNNVNARLGRERGRALDWYLAGVRKYSSILQRLLPIEDAIAIVGLQKAQAWDSWRKKVPASLAFTALPDSAQRTDLAVDRKRAMDEYSFIINAAGINKMQLTKELLVKLRWSSKVFDPTPPQPHPEPTKPTFGFKGDDLNPLNPQFPIVMEILRQAGVNVSPQAVQEAQTAAAHQVALGTAAGTDTGLGSPGSDTSHGGKLPQMENLSRHAQDITGGMQGTGAPAPLGPGGTLQ